MSDIRYLLVLLAMALTLVEQLTCHPGPWNLPQLTDNQDLLSTVPSQDTYLQVSEKHRATKSNDLTSLSLAPSKDRNSHGIEQVRTTQVSYWNSVPTAPSLDINDQTIELGGGTQSRKSALLSTITPSMDTSSPTRTTLPTISDSVSSTQKKNSNDQASKNVRTLSNLVPLSTTKETNEKAKDQGKATKSNSHAPVSTAPNKDINAPRLATNDQIILPPGNCPQMCQCELSKDYLNITITNCTQDPSEVLSTVLDHQFTEVDIVKAKLATFPCKALQGQGLMIKLRLWGNVITNISCNFDKFPQLQSLDMARNELQTIPVDILYNNIDTLSFSHNKIREVSPFAYRSALTLDLSHNLIENMPTLRLLLMQRIQHMNLSHNHLKSIPCNLTNVYTLKTLDLGYNAIREVPCSMAYMDILWKLVLTHNELTEVPKNMNIRLLKMRELDMSYNALISISCDLVSMPGLSVLDISHNAITKVTGNMSRSSLQELNLAYNTLDTVPCNLPAMDNLRLLDLGHNNLRDGGCNLSAMLFLSELDLSNNYLTTIPFNPFMMPSLSHLDLSWNQLVTVPSTLLMMPRLQNLKLRNNALKTFPNAPSMVPSLQWLDLSHNFLQTMPFGNTKFRSLNVLDLSRNSLHHVSSEALLSLSNVPEIYLDDNKLQRLPDDIATVTLGPNNQLRLSGNPWICDCEGLTTRDWIVANCKSIQDILKIRCNAPDVAKGRKLISTDTNIFCPKGMNTAIAVLVGVVTLLLACFPLICAIKIRNTVEVHERKAWEPMYWNEDEDEGKEFDVFVVYCNEDEEYVGEYLIPELEACGFKVCFHRVHFLGGKSIIDNICECIAKSKKVLVFYSHNFTKSNFGMYEFNMAMDLDAQNATTRLITIKDTDVDIQNLQITHSTYFRTNSYIIREEPRFWQNLVYTLPHHRLGTIEVPDHDN